MISKWFLSKSARHADEMRKHVQKLLDAQRDILSPQAVTGMEAALQEVRQAIKSGADDEAMKKQATNLEAAANKWLKPYPHAGIRENVEVLLVALSVAMGIRTFFLQPFKIPTGSMQPTLFGVMPSPGPYAANQLDLKIPGPVTRFYETWIKGASYVNIVAPEDGVLNSIKPPVRMALFNLKQDYEFNHKWYTVWSPPDELFARAGYHADIGGTVIDAPHFKAGEPIVRLRITAGDHLFVDRVSYNFRHPKRGEIIVFETRDIGNQFGHLPPDQFYIKRLVALGGERVELGKDRHLVINGQRLDKTTPHFENVYSFDPAMPPRESHFSGHVDGPQLAPLFVESSDGSVTVRPEHYIVMGDNTLNSYDSRAWGDFSRTNVIGKYFLVYWPFSERFGWSAR